jgi:hypothetical protein
MAALGNKALMETLTIDIGSLSAKADAWPATARRRCSSRSAASWPAS